MASMHGHRGYGPVAEAATVDKCSREITRDTWKVLRFVNAETDQKKKDELMHLYHMARYFIDTWDGISDESKAGNKGYAKDVTVLWTKLLNQPNGRKIIVVQMGGVTIPDATYYGYWCTVRGCSTAQLSALEAYVDKMRAIAEAPSATIESIDEIATDTVDGEADIDAVIDAIDTTGDANATMDTDIDNNIVAERDNAETSVTGIKCIDGNVSIEDMVNYIDRKVEERTRQMLATDQQTRAIETGNTETPRATNEAAPMAADVNSDTNSVVSLTENAREPSIDHPDGRKARPWTAAEFDAAVQFEALNGGENDHSAKGPIAQTMEDSGLAPPTIDSQVLPAPNVAIDILDNTTNDGFETSSGWFDDHAALINGTSTPGKPKLSLTIDLNEGVYRISTKE